MRFYFFVIGLFYLSNTLAQQHQNGNMYLIYDIPYGKYYNIDQEITPQQLAEGTFWALTFGFNELNEGAYIGIQTDYSDVKKGMLIFSVWNAVDAIKGDSESFVVNFGGEGSGKSCRMSIPLIETHTYRVRIWQIESNNAGTFWGAWIFDKSIQKEYYLGKIKTTQQTTISNQVSNFVEYYGHIKPCNNVPFSSARFNSVKLNCNDILGNCESTYNPIKFKYAECVKGSCSLNSINSNVLFGGE
jgi:hypothetical protein